MLHILQTLGIKNEKDNVKKIRSYIQALHIYFTKSKYNWTSTVLIHAVQG